MNQNKAPFYEPFLIGGMSGMTATSVIQPVDMIKVQIQMRGKSGLSTNPFNVFKEMLGNGKGFLQFYKGLDSALIRQITYTTSRLGIYKVLFNKMSEKRNGNLFFRDKAFCSLTAGFLGSLVGNPADLILIRLQTDQNLPEKLRRNYTGFSNAFTRIINEEGIYSLWRGSFPTVLRAMSLNFGMLAPNDQIKEMLDRDSTVKNSLSTRLIAASASGFLASFLSLPFDNAKTKIQNMIKNEQGVFPYKNVFDCMLKTIRSDGVSGLWVGFPTFYFRIAPHCMMTLLVQDYLTNLAKKRRNK